MSPVKLQGKISHCAFCTKCVLRVGNHIKLNVVIIQVRVKCRKRDVLKLRLLAKTVVIITVELVTMCM